MRINAEKYYLQMSFEKSIKKYIDLLHGAIKYDKNFRPS